MGKHKTTLYDTRKEPAKKFIREFWEKNHFSPSLRELCDALAENRKPISSSMCRLIIFGLEEEGWLEKRPHGRFHNEVISRNITPTRIFANRPVWPEYVSYDGGKFTVVGEKLSNGDVAI